MKNGEGPKYFFATAALGALVALAWIFAGLAKHTNVSDSDLTVAVAFFLSATTSLVGLGTYLLGKKHGKDEKEDK